MARDEELSNLSLARASELLRTKAISPVDLVTASLDRIENLNRVIGAFITVVEDAAIGAAQTAEREIVAGNYKGALHGVPIGHKDVFATAGIRTTGNSRAYLDWVPTNDAALVAAWKAGGAVIVGKTNTYELAAGRDQAMHGIPRNPWNLNRVTGGSSSGSAAAVTASMVFGASGSDGGGSIRAPAAHCGIVGFRPTFGLLSSDGLIPRHWSSTNVVGPIARTVADVRLLFQEALRFSARTPTQTAASLDAGPNQRLDGLRGKKIGVPLHYFLDRSNMSNEVFDCVQAVIKTGERLGANLLSVPMPHAHLSDAIHNVLAAAEFSTIADHDDINPDVIGPSTRITLEAGRRVTAYEYFLAQSLRNLVRNDFISVFEAVDVLIVPTTSTVAQPPEVDIMQAPFPRRPASLAGCPAISIPAGISDDGLPIGVQLIAGPQNDWTLLAIAQALEEGLSLQMKPPSQHHVALEEFAIPASSLSPAEAIELKALKLKTDLREALASVDEPLPTASSTTKNSVWH